MRTTAVYIIEIDIHLIQGTGWIDQIDGSELLWDAEEIRERKVIAAAAERFTL